MPSVTETRFYYESGVGPIRNGVQQNKPTIWPTVNASDELDFDSFVKMAEAVVDWGQTQFANDHGTRDDHQQLVDFVNAAVIAAASSLANRRTVPAMR